MQFSWFSTCLLCMPPWAPSPISHTPSMVSHGCNLRTWEVKTELEAPGYPQLHIQFKTSLGFIRSHLKKKKKKSMTARFVLRPRQPSLSSGLDTCSQRILAMGKMGKIVVIGHEEGRKSLFDVSGD